MRVSWDKFGINETVKWRHLGESRESETNNWNLVYALSRKLINDSMRNSYVVEETKNMTITFPTIVFKTYLEYFFAVFAWFVWDNLRGSHTQRVDEWNGPSSIVFFSSRLRRSTLFEFQISIRYILYEITERHRGVVASSIKICTYVIRVWRRLRREY